MGGTKGDAILMADYVSSLASCSQVIIVLFFQLGRMGPRISSSQVQRLKPREAKGNRHTVSGNQMLLFFHLRSFGILSSRFCLSFCLALNFVFFSGPVKRAHLPRKPKKRKLEKVRASLVC